MAEHGPLVSVVVPAYNVAPFIPTALESVFAQTYAHHEVIVVNDGSPDTAELERALSPYGERIRYVAQENRGPSAARNTGIRLARGELVAFLDADDALLPIFLEEHVSRALADPASSVFYGDLETFGDVPEGGPTVMDLNPSEGEVDFISLVMQRCNPTLCSVVRRRTLLEHGLFDETLRRSEDFDLWLRLAHSGIRFNYTRRVVARYRVREGGLAADVVQMLQSICVVLEKCLRTMTLTDGERETVRHQRTRFEGMQRLHEGKRAFAARDFAQARTALAQANVALRSRKLAAVAFMLGVAPRLLWQMENLRERVLVRGTQTRR
jgi:glycosyltransferase involved in cell wall biosynthesis